MARYAWGFGEALRRSIIAGGRALSGLNLGIEGIEGDNRKAPLPPGMIGLTPPGMVVLAPKNGR